MKFIDLNYKQFKTTDIARCLTTRYIAAPTNHTCENSGVLIGGGGNMEIKIVGNKNPSGPGQGGVVYEAEGIFGAVNVANTTAPNVAVRAVCTPEYHEKHQNGRRIKDEGEPMFTLTAQDRHGVAILRKERNEYGKSIRKDYEAGKVAESRHNMTQYACREDGISNTLSTVQKDNLLMCAYDEQNNTLRIDGTVGTLTTDGSSPKHNNRVIVGGNSVRIRRLTPRECWRLQGFPDEYFDKAKAAGISDSQLYKMAGNAVSVPVAKAIGLKLKEIENG